MQKLLIALCCSLLLVAGCSKEGRQSGSRPRPLEKHQAPAISVVALDNSPLTLEPLRGKVVLLNFWATWCPPCREEIPSMMKLNQQMAGKPFQMVCVSVDEGGKQAVQKFFKESGFFLPTYLDPSGQAAAAYGLTGVPETFVIDKNGVIAKKIIGGLDWASPEVVGFLEDLMKQSVKDSDGNT